MFQDFIAVEDYILGKAKEGVKKAVALCGAHDDLALSAVVNARRKGVIDAVLIGKENAIRELLVSMGESPSDYEIIDEADEGASAQRAVSLVHEGRADIPMKGLMQSTTYLTAIVHPIKGLLPFDGLLNEATVFYYPDAGRLMFAGDCALNVMPTLENKAKIISNIAQLARVFGCSDIKVAVLSAAETVNPSIVSSVDAEALSKMEWDDITVDGPFALDNALSEEAAHHKGITSSIAGHADILLMPDLVSGNIFHKAAHFFGHIPFASVMCGTTSPVIFNSRTDDADAKYYSILSAVLQSLRGSESIGQPGEDMVVGG